MKFHFDSTVAIRVALVSVALVLLGACSSGPKKPTPADLGPDPALLRVRLAWTAKVGPVDVGLDLKVNDKTVTVANSEGVLAAFDSASGAELWRTALGVPIAAGVGSDGKLSAVVTRANDLLVLDGGREIWRQKLQAPSFTAPVVAGGRVFLLTADRSVTAFDALSGRKLWNQQRPGESLVLRQAGVLLAVADTLVAGFGGRLAGLHPGTGSVRWEAPIATPRGTNDIERLVDLVGRVARDGTVVCARAFQAAVGCVDTARGTVLWSKPALGSVGVHGDDKLVFGVESDGKVIAWRRGDGDRAWVSERLLYRSLTTPLAVGRSVVVGDESGSVHWLSREDGSILTRMTTDGSALLTGPVLANGTLVVVTRNGNIFGFRPE